MRFSIAALAALFVSATLAGCGGSNIPGPPANAKGGPPPGSDTIAQSEAKAKADVKAAGKTKKR